MLHFERDAARPPHLVALDGDRLDDAPRGALATIRSAGSVTLVLVATLLAVVVDLVDATPAWSQYAAMVSAVVLAAHALLTRR
jgi:hypothetical protein